jgi:DNA-binding SARP family transcriptional activator/Tfp pilus assembly protein PilF
VPGRRKQRLALAVLLLHANRAVSAEVLLDALWADKAPSSARANLQSYISDLRRLLNTEEPAGPSRLRRVRAGYLLRVSPDELDIMVFERLAAEGRKELAQQRHAIAAQRLARALALWRGAVLEDLPLPDVLRPEVDRLEQLRLAALEDSVEARLAVEEPEVLTADLTALTAAHPLRERLWAQLMLALYRCDRQAEALAAYQRVYRLLDEELGVQPGQALQRLHQQVLSADAALTPSATTVHPRGSPKVVPRQLPTPPQMFTGRLPELAALDRVVDASTVVITAIDGMGGIGKTALAVHWAHQVAGRFPDGQLYVDLHGFTAGVPPVEPADALDRLLRDVGVPGERIPAGLDQRAALWRSQLADRRMLIVLDNAATEAHVQPLLPGAAGCLVVVTSRRRLTALESTSVVSLDTLPPADAVELFARTADRPELTTDTSEPAAELVEVVELCGRLPLAIRIAAARLRHRRAWTVADQAVRLQNLGTRLAALDDGQRGVHATLHLSYQHLSAEAQRLYRLLGCHPGPEIDPYAATALTGGRLDEVGRLLDGLADDHLLQEPTPGRYRFHDLVRAHAADSARSDDSEAHRRAALDRLLAYYRHAAATAMDKVYPYERQRRPTIPPANTPTPELTHRRQADRWLDTELTNLLAITQHAAEHGDAEQTCQLSTILDRHLLTRGWYGDAERLQQHALTLARHFGNRQAEMSALHSLGRVNRMLGRHEQAGDYYRGALRIAQDTGDHLCELYALTGLARVHWMLGQHEEAGGHFTRALRIAQDTGDRLGEADALMGLGRCHKRMGDYQQAADHYERAALIARETDDPRGELRALAGLGRVYSMLGQYEQAVYQFDRALPIAQDTGDLVEQLQPLTGLAEAHRMAGRNGEAERCYQRVVDLAHQLGIRNWQYEALQGLGRLHYANGYPDRALTHHEQALRLATALDQPADLARAHDGLAHAYRALHRLDSAREHWQHALDILTSLGVEQSEDSEASVPNIRDHLASLDQHGRGPLPSEPADRPGSLPRAG